MDSTRYCAFNKTRGIFLGLDIAQLDAALEPLKVLKILIEGIGPDTRGGAWLTHFRAVPVARAIEPFDLIYLDAEHRVVHAVALSPDGEFMPFSGNPSSALVLPSGIIASSHTATGDQFIVVSSLRAPEAEVAEPVPSQPAGEPGILAPPQPPLPVPLPASFGSAVSHGIGSEKETPAAPLPTQFAVPRSLAAASHPLTAPPPTAIQPPPQVPLSRRPVAQPLPPSPELPPAKAQATPSAPVTPVPTAAAMSTPPVSPAIPQQPAAPQTPYTASAPAQPETVPPRVFNPAIAVPPPLVDLPRQSAARNYPPLPPPPPIEKSLPRPVPSAPVKVPPALPSEPVPVTAVKPAVRKESIPQLIRRHSIPQIPYEPTVSERVRNFIFRRKSRRFVFDRRRATRLGEPGLVAYFFTGGAPDPYHIDNISVTGFYMKGSELWTTGTIIRMTLQRTGTLGDEPGDSITVHSKLVRRDETGGGFEFVLSGFLERASNSNVYSRKNLSPHA